MKRVTCRHNVRLRTRLNNGNGHLAWRVKQYWGGGGLLSSLYLMDDGLKSVLGWVMGWFQNALLSKEGNARHIGHRIHGSAPLSAGLLQVVEHSLGR